MPSQGHMYKCVGLQMEFCWDVLPRPRIRPLKRVRREYR